MDTKPLWDRLAAEITRDPVFEKYPVLLTTADAVEFALEQVEEMVWEDDPHAWCHERPVLVSLIAAGLRHIQSAPQDPHEIPEPPRPKAYTCWCDGSACDGVTRVPFTVCDHCVRWGHSPLPHGNLEPKDIEVTG